MYLEKWWGGRRQVGNLSGQLPASRVYFGNLPQE